MSGKKKFIALVLFHSAIILFLLLYDERLNPEIPVFINGTAANIDDRDNAFFAFAGFDAGQGKDIHATGAMVAHKLIDEVTKNPLLEKCDIDSLLGQKLFFKGKDLLKGNDGRFTYFPDVVQRKSTIEELLVENQNHVSRYSLLYSYASFYETIPVSPASPSLSYANIRHTHRLILWKIAMDVQEGNIAAALNHLRRDTAFWRMVLEESQDLITKLVATNAVRQNCQLLSELLVYRPHAAALLSANDPLLQNLTSSEQDMSAPMRRELEYNISSMKKMKRDLWRGREDRSEEGRPYWFLAPLLKINSSSNMLYEDFAKMAKIAALPAPEFADEMVKRGYDKQQKSGCEILYNFTGKFMFGVADSATMYIKYIQKVHDLDGFISLLNLQLRAKQQQVKASDMQDFLDEADPAFANPYTGEPMQWDGEKKCFYFESIATGGGETRRVELLL